MRKFYIVTGGTFSDISPHFSVCARAFGTVGEQLQGHLRKAFAAEGPANLTSVHVVPTRMARGSRPVDDTLRGLFNRAGVGDLVTPRDVGDVLNVLIADPDTRGIILPVAMVDFEPVELHQEGLPMGGRSTDIGLHRPRLNSRDGNVTVTFRPTEKVIGRVRETRKDIFAVGFKTTSGATPDEQYFAGLRLLKENSLNLVLANDIRRGRNMVITPEQARYHEGVDRDASLRGLAEMIALRSRGHFTRATVVPGDAVPWASDAIAPVLRAVVDHCIARGAYKPFNGVTVGHFAARGISPQEILTSRRKTDFNKLLEIGLVRVESTGVDNVVAYGAKPSVGGMSQRMIFADHPDVDCIFHAHVPLRPGSKVPVASQRENECGSHECGANTSRNLRDMGDGIKAVMLDQHGPNVVFPRDIDPAKVIAFIEANFDLSGRTDHVAT